MAYTQAKVKTDIYQQLPTRTTVTNLNPTKHVLKLKQNLYKVTWHDHIKAGLNE